MAARQIFQRLSSTTFAAVLAFGLTGCWLRGSGTPMTDSREVEAFDSIEIGGAFELVVHVDPAAKQRVDVSGDDNIVPEVTTTVSGGELEIAIEHGMVRPKLDLKVEVWVASLAGIDASGASDITVEGLHGEAFDLDLSGASDSSFSGSVDRFEIDLSGASDLDARELHAKIVDIELSGAGEADVWASERLVADISGAGSVRYFGNPKEVEQDVSGAGSITPGS